MFYFEQEVSKDRIVEAILYSRATTYFSDLGVVPSYWWIHHSWPFIQHMSLTTRSNIIVFCLSNNGHWKKYVLRFQILVRLQNTWMRHCRRLMLLQWGSKIKKWAKTCHFESRKKQCLEVMFFIKYFGGCVEV